MKLPTKDYLVIAVVLVVLMTAGISAANLPHRDIFSTAHITFPCTDVAVADKNAPGHMHIEYMHIEPDGQPHFHVHVWRVAGMKIVWVWPPDPVVYLRLYGLRVP